MSRMIMKTFCILSIFICTSSAQEISLGRCPNFSVIQHFDLQRYLGRWYEYSNYFFLFQLFGDCVTEAYEDISYSGPTKIKVVYRYVSSLKGTPNGAEGSATLGEPNNPSKPGKLIVRFDGQPAFTESTTTNYNILDTDYDNYAIVYSCNQKFFDLFKTELLWILTRERRPSYSVIQKAMSVIRKQGIDTKRLKQTRQTNCPA